MYKKRICAVCVTGVLALASASYADLVIGDWEQDMDGWQLHGDAPEGTDIRYSDSNGVTLGNYSLDVYVPVGEYKLILYYNIVGQGILEDFRNYQKISIDVTRLANEWPEAGDWIGGGIHMVLNAGGDGWSLWEGDYQGWWSWSGGDQTVTLTWDYAQHLSRIDFDNLWWLEFFFISNFDLDYDLGGVYYLDNCVLWGSGAATEPQPTNDARDVATETTLSWKAPATAASHTVYLGTDFEAVADANLASDPNLVTIANVDVSSFDPGTLEFNTTYFWRVDEVNDTDLWPGSVWSFTTANFIVVDDFESYTDDFEAGEAIFQTWTDGWEDPANGGSQVGYDEAPFAEQTIVHGGNQSMPLTYNNVDASYSQAERTWDEPQDWTLHGFDALKIYVTGSADNVADQLYVRIEDSEGNAGTVTYPDSAIVNAAEWTEWLIPLSEFNAADANVAAITKMVIGVGSQNGPSGAQGILYIDDIRLCYAPTGLVAYYALENNTEDSSGNGHHGVLAGDPNLPVAYVTGPAGFGTGMLFDGAFGHQYVDLGNLNPSARTGQLSVALWAKWDGLTDAWQGLISKRDSWSRYDMLWQIEANQSTGVARFQRDGEAEVSAGVLPIGEWTHVAATFDGTTAKVYVNGAMTAEDSPWSFGYDPGAAMQIGACDPGGGNPFNGALDEVRLYDRALSEAEILELAGK